jgi:hypothetical protein
VTGKFALEEESEKIEDSMLMSADMQEDPSLQQLDGVSVDGFTTGGGGLQQQSWIKGDNMRSIEEGSMKDNEIDESFDGSVNGSLNDNNKEDESIATGEGDNNDNSMGCYRPIEQASNILSFQSYL